MGRSTAKLEVVKAQRTLADLPTSFVLCRRGSGIGHAWDVVTFWQRSGGQIGRLSRCGRCTAEKEDHYTAHMMRVRTMYFYPDGYGVDEYPEPYEVRRELVARFTIEPSDPRERTTERKR